MLGFARGFGGHLEDVLTSGSQLLKLKRSGSKTIVLGDWNVDVLPACESDPWGEKSACSTRIGRNVMPHSPFGAQLVSLRAWEPRRQAGRLMQSSSDHTFAP
jgi:hypothetical protein